MLFPIIPRLLAPCWACWLLFAVSPVFAQPGGADLAAVVPADAAMFVGIPDLKAAYGKYLQTGLGKWLASPDMAKFKDSLKDTGAVSLTNLQGLFGFEEKLLGTFAAPAVIMALPTKADGSDGDIVLLIKIDAKDPAVVAALASADKYHTGRKAKKASLKIEKTDFAMQYLTPIAAPAPAPVAPAVGKPPAVGKAPAAAPAPPAPVEHVYFAANGYFGVSSGTAGVQALMKNWPAAAASSLNATPGFVAATKPLAGNSDLLWFVQPVPMTKMVEGPPKKRGDRPWSNILANQTFDSIAGIASQLNLLTATADAEFNLFVAAPKPYKKGMRILSFTPGPKLPLPAWLGAGNSEVTWINSDPTEQFKAYANWFDELEADGEAGTFDDIMKSMQDDPKGPKVNLEKEFWAKLGSSTLSVTDPNGKPNVAIPLGVRSMMVCTVTDVAGIKASLTKLFAGDKDVRAEDIPGGKLWSVAPGKALFIAGGGGNLPKTNTAAILGNHVILGDDTQWVRDMAAKPPAVAAAADPVLAPVIKRVEAGETKETAVRQVARFDEAWKASYEGLRLGDKEVGKTQSVRMLKMILTGDTTDKFAKNYALLPAFAAVKVYLSPGGASFDSSAEGIKGRGFMLKP